MGVVAPGEKIEQTYNVGSDNSSLHSASEALIIIPQE